MGNPKGNIPWNKGKHGIYTEETKRKIGLAASLRNKGRKLTRKHKKRLSLAHTKKMCSQCSKKSHKGIYKVGIPVLSPTIVFMFCNDCFLSQYSGLSQEERKGVQIL